jgi:hypothetical protein
LARQGDAETFVRADEVVEITDVGVVTTVQSSIATLNTAICTHRNSHASQRNSVAAGLVDRAHPTSECRG